MIINMAAFNAQTTAINISPLPLTDQSNGRNPTSNTLTEPVLRNSKNNMGGVFGNMRTAEAQISAQGLHCPLIESLDTTERMNGEQRPGRHPAHAQEDLNLRRHYFA